MQIALDWLYKDFDPYTKPRVNGGYRLLLMDSHSSHTSYEFLEYCLENRIVPFFLPAHSTHHLQPLDVRVFSPYQRYFTEAVDAEMLRSHGALSIGKHNFFPIL
jgi:hypothetical protein